MFCHKLKLFLISGLLAFLFYAGVLLGGSDGDWFPWANLVGAVMIAAFGLIAVKLRAPIR